MSDTLGRALVPKAPSQSPVLERQSKAHSRISDDFTNGIVAASRADRARKGKWRPLLSNRFVENTLTVKTEKLHPRLRILSTSIIPHAVLATDPSSEELLENFKLDEGSELKVITSAPCAGSPLQINILVTNGSGLLILHWGIIKDKKDWVFPSHYPEGTTKYKKRALRTPFIKSGSSYSLTIEINEPGARAIEFLILDDSQNKWFKNNGQNFYVALPQNNVKTVTLTSPENHDISLPEDLVQIQAYLRWERKGKQNYTPAQEKEEYEAARAELLDEISRGTSIDDIRSKLTEHAVDHTETPKSETKTLKSESEFRKSEEKVPDDLVQVQAYIRWEKAGKPAYSQEKQLIEFEEAKKELQVEIDRGLSVDEIRKKILKGDIQAKVSKQLQKKKYFLPEKIRRKKRDVMQFLNMYSPETVKVKEPITIKVDSALEFYTTSQLKDGSLLLNKKKFKLGDGELLVVAAKCDERMKIYVVTDLDEPLILHWALSRKSGEWLAPPLSSLPLNSVSLDTSCETPFTRKISENPFFQVQVVEIEIGDDSFNGLPFVLRAEENWIKNGQSDFYFEFNTSITNLRKDISCPNGQGTAKPLLDKIAELESEAQKSFMHRFNIAADLMETARDAGELGIAGLCVWMRFMATRQLIWNKNYNVKPREISKAQDRLTSLLESTYEQCPQHREILRIIMSTVGRGGEGDVGQRIRDEILVIQRNNDCKGGMMEEWHQKLHNNTSPDDVVICQALIDYINSDFDTNVYWETLKSNGITKERLLSYDRAIHSDPSFRRDQKEGLLHDLTNYMRTLKAVHSGADLESAIATCMGYKSEGQGFMVGVQINPIRDLPSGFPELLQFVLDHVEDKEVEPLLEGLLEARMELRSLLLKSHERLKDLLFLDIALDSTVRTAVERGYEELNTAGSEKIVYFIILVLENLAISSDDNEDLVYCLKGWNRAIEIFRSKDPNWALFAKSCLDRTRLALSSKAEKYQQLLQPSAEYLGWLLGIDQSAINIFTEEIVRAGSAASLSALLRRIDPTLRKVANLGSWQIISPIEATGYVVTVDKLLSVQNKCYEKPTILVANTVKGEEEIPDGTVAVLTPDMPDVLSHVSVRARNGKICFATCFDPNILNDLRQNAGKLYHLKPTAADIIYSEMEESDLTNTNLGIVKEDQASSTITLVGKQFSGRYAISAEEFDNDLVGAKSRNIAFLKGKVPSWIGIPTSVALPFGVFEKVLSDDVNQPVAVELQILKMKLGEGEYEALGEIRRKVLQLTAPRQLVLELKEKMLKSEMPWPGDEGENRWEKAWLAIKKVWASKWNERAFFSTRKVKLDHDLLCMAVLVQEIISADYAFVIHTTNPSSGDSSEIYAELVKGLGETLVGAYPGRALSFVCQKNDLNSPKILGYPSKPIGLFIKPSIIFRSDSNGEDLEGYAGAGLYDSVPMDKEEKVILDYSCDPLVVDVNFCNTILSSIARAGTAIEDLYGSPQDIEGVVKDGKIFVVQTRPQM